MDQKRKRPQPAINTGGGAYIHGNVNTGGGDFVGRDQFNLTFKPVYGWIKDAALPEPVKEKLTTTINKVGDHLSQNSPPDESFLTRQLHNIQKMAPDILDVILSTLAGPQAAAMTVLKKVINKIKEEKTAAQSPARA